MKNGITDVQSVLSQASSMASSYSTIKRQANQGEKGSNIVNNWVENGLDATNTKIVGGFDESLLFDKSGFWCRQVDPITGEVSDEQIKIFGSTIAITDDKWNTTRTAIGKYYYTDPHTNERKVAYGVNGETIVGKLLIGEQLDITNENGTLEFGTDGFVVRDENNTVTINPNNESIFNISNNSGNILSLNERGELVLVGNITASNLTLLDGTTIESNNITGLSDVAISGDYNDLENKPSFSDVAISGSYDDLKNKPSLSDVATSGSYSDLKNKPTKVSSFTNDAGYLTDDSVPEIIEDALLQAKESGDFDGVSVTHLWEDTVLTITSASGTSSSDLKGDSPVRGIDYWTDEDKAEIVGLVITELRNQGVIS